MTRLRVEAFQYRRPKESSNGSGAPADPETLRSLFCLLMLSLRFTLSSCPPQAEASGAFGSSQLHVRSTQAPRMDHCWGRFHVYRPEAGPKERPSRARVCVCTCVCVCT